MSNILTHNTNLAGGTVQTYATDGNTVVLDLNNSLGDRDDTGRPVLEMTQLQALGLARILEAGIRDAQQGTFVPPTPDGDA